MASVYRARRIDDPHASDVALKRLHPHLIDNARAVASFVREARIGLLLDHPSIRRVFSLCRDGGELMMTMEYVEGASLYRVLTRASAEARRLPLPGVLTVLGQLCDVLRYAHELVDENATPVRFVHRDISPSNLIISTGGRLKVVDMGVARVTTGDLATRPGGVKGKYGYMAPEVLWGRAFDRRADIYSTGVVAWELLTSYRLFPSSGSHADVLRVRARPIDAPSSYNPACPKELDAVVLRALAADPAQRWGSAAALGNALRHVAAQVGDPLPNGVLATWAHKSEDKTAVSGVPEQVARSGLARGTGGVFAAVPAVPPVIASSPPAAPPVIVSSAAPALPSGPPAIPSVPEYSARITTKRVRSATRGATARYRRPLLACAAVASLVIAGFAATTDDDVSAAAPTSAAKVSVAAPAIGGADAGPSAGPTRRRPHAASVSAARVQATVTVLAAEVTRVYGARPRSRSSRARFRARMCISARGRVSSATMLAGPRRLQRRITRALRRWRYRPYLRAGRAEPACFEISARLRKTG